ncbi:beta-galactosidase [Bifidobacterium sp. DSM 109958]|uniref:Beta-galactosidase n=1 Tax=Bifidobacterium moraviense TaxID=2675323 RepID=A0A7Y0HYB4_9BIFI|nr:glycoside hydrolase family 2 TIM barrel-domain containing protein [Bifidobacterium sp. DSM 109958]NMN00262.1 beta-galactosidase [Bifidobacterium sp. DSM 109958]
MSQAATLYFHHGWKFQCADAFPIREALARWRDADGRDVFDPAYDDASWQSVALPHTFNDVDIFRDRILDGGSRQKRCAAFYRNRLTVPPEHRGQKVILEFEGIRQTCYLYVNGTLAGYVENGVAPFGIDVTSLIDDERPNQITVVTDNTSSRNLPFYGAETPNRDGVEPGSYIARGEGDVPAGHPEGTPFFWNTNDFNPTLGGITRPVKVHFKPYAYLTLPLYSNLRTKGTYVTASDFDLSDPAAPKARITVESEVRNERDDAVEARLKVVIRTLDGVEVASFASAPQTIAAVGTLDQPPSITPDDAYAWNEQEQRYVAVDDEDAVRPTVTDSRAVSVMQAQSEAVPLRLWSLDDPYLYRVTVTLEVSGEDADETVIETGFRKIGYDNAKGVTINDVPVWLRGYAQRATNEWSATGIAAAWMKDEDAALIRASNANHVRWMHVAASPADVAAYDAHGVVCTQPAGDKEKETFGRQWDQRVELMRDVIIAFRNNPSIVFWEAGNNSLHANHMHEMLQLKRLLDPRGGRFMGCRTLNTEETVAESEYVGTMLNRHAARFIAEHGPVTETEYAREEAPGRIWDDYTGPDYDYRNKWIGVGGRKGPGVDFYDLTAEGLALADAHGYAEFFNDRLGGGSHRDLYAAAAALCWTDSAQHGRQSYSENARMSGRVRPDRVRKQNFDVFRVMQSEAPAVKIVGHWNYEPANTAHEGPVYRYEKKRFNGRFWEGAGEFGYRDPTDKTVYAIASYPVARVELLVNGEKVGECDSPTDTFVFAFEHVDVTRSGAVEAVAYGYDGREVARDRIETAGKPTRLVLEPHAAPGGLRADGEDLAWIDVTVVDDQGRVCPLASDRIDFSLEGPATFLGGYNEGRFDDRVDGRPDDSVIHTSHVFADCGLNRVFLRAGETPGVVRVTASMDGVPQAVARIRTVTADLSPLSDEAPARSYARYAPVAPLPTREFPPNKAADKAKYVPPSEDFCKILIDGQEPDSRMVPTVNKNGAVWGNVMVVLERMTMQCGDRFTYAWDPAAGTLTLRSGGHVVQAQVGRTHLLVDGRENLMDGEPYLSPRGDVVMEVAALVSWIEDVTVQYDERVHVLRVDTGALDGGDAFTPAAMEISAVPSPSSLARATVR